MADPFAFRRVEHPDGFVRPSGHSLLRGEQDEPALPAVAETAHPMPDVEKKRLALLLAVVADIDTGSICLSTIRRNVALPTRSSSGPTPWFGC